VIWQRGHFVPVNQNLHVFYYPWYGNPENDGGYRHWNHEIINEVDAGNSYPGGDDIGANFYPQLGCYSSHDPKIIDIHMRQMRDAGIGVVSTSWWGQGSFEDEILITIMDTARKYGLTVNVHLEPFYKTIEMVADAIHYLDKKISSHPALFRVDEKPLYYVYDAYKLINTDWQRLLTEHGDLSIRYTRTDANFIGLLLDLADTTGINESGFDGAYTYFASTGFTECATPENWPRLSDWSRRNNKQFIPSIGPGYSDTRIRPWNAHSQKEREDGRYYDGMFASAVNSNPDIITITSFNEWHEGTQIESAIPHYTTGYVYENYGSLHPDFYLERTRFWSDQIRYGGNIDLAKYSEDELIIEHIVLGKTYTVEEEPHPKYRKDWDTKLTDGKLGSLQYNDGSWIGFEGNDIGMVLDLGENSKLSNITIQFLHREDVWIFQPLMVNISISDDGVNYESVYTEHLPEITPGTSTIKTVSTRINGTGRYVCLEAENIGECPEGHPGMGNPAWLFIDEIIVR